MVGRVTNVSTNRVNKLLIDAVLACGAFDGVADLGWAEEARPLPASNFELKHYGKSGTVSHPCGNPLRIPRR